MLKLLSAVDSGGMMMRMGELAWLCSPSKPPALSRASALPHALQTLNQQAREETDYAQQATFKPLNNQTENGCARVRGTARCMLGALARQTQGGKVAAIDWGTDV